MDQIIHNLLFALAIGGVIMAMASISKPQLKATIYSLPIPISIALVATGGTVGSSHVVGLFLVVLFLWIVHALHHKGWPIYLADLTAVTGYVAAGYMLVSLFQFSFYHVALAYFVLWIVFMYHYHHNPSRQYASPGIHIPPGKKGSLVTAVAFLLLSVKSYLAGIIVTFPFSGMFAVIESRRMLHTLAAVFTRNSIAILFMFVVMHNLTSLSLLPRLALGWLAYMAALRAVTRYFPLKSGG